MKELLDNATLYHTVDGLVKVILTEQELNNIKGALELCDDLLSRVKLVIYAEQNACIHFNYKEMEEPTLENFGILLKNGKMDKKLWFKYKDIIKEIKEGIK